MLNGGAQTLRYKHIRSHILFLFCFFFGRTKEKRLREQNEMRDKITKKNEKILKKIVCVDRYGN